jgi:hypothetical protein
MKTSIAIPVHLTSRTALFLSPIIILAFLSVSFAQPLSPLRAERDPCGYPDTSAPLYKKAAAAGFGYGYDSLKYDLGLWKKSPFVTIDSIGATVLNRGIFMLTIQDTAFRPQPRERVWIHARTHPVEVQGTWVTDEIIGTLLSKTPLAERLRDRCVFNIVPMYNPDGVELGFARENANGVDIESDWNTTPNQKEVVVLRTTFTALMAQENPIRIALNIHSAYGTSRYFVYHTATGTSALYSSMEIRFIDTVRSNFPGGIEPYTYFQSWTASAALQYPESWFWYNHHEQVLALTYEDMNDASANSFDKTAEAILHGIGDDLGVLDSPALPVLTAASLKPGLPGLKISSNGIGQFLMIAYSSPRTGRMELAIHDLLGRTVALLFLGTQSAGEHLVRYNTALLSRGSYVITLRTENGGFSTGMAVIR